MSTIATLAVALKASSGDFRAQMEGSAASVKGFERSHLSLKQVMEETRTPIQRHEAQLEQLRQWYGKGKIDLETFTRATDKSTEAFRKSTIAAHEHGKAIHELGHHFGELIETIGAVELAEKMYEQVKQGFERVGAESRMSLRLGVSVTEMGQLEYAADAAKVPVQALAMGFERLLKSIGDLSTGAVKSKELSEAFAALNLDAAKLAKESPFQAFQEVADGISKMENAAQRTSALRAIFGRGGGELLPLFELSGSQMHGLFAEAIATHFARTEAEARKVERAEMAMARATDALKGSVTDLAVAASPYLEELADFARAHHSASAAMTGVTGAGATLLLALPLLRSSFSALSSAVKGTGSALSLLKANPFLTAGGAGLAILAAQVIRMAAAHETWAAAAYDNVRAIGLLRDETQDLAVLMQSMGDRKQEIVQTMNAVGGAKDLATKIDEQRRLVSLYQQQADAMREAIKQQATFAAQENARPWWDVLLRPVTIGAPDTNVGYTAKSLQDLLDKLHAAQAALEGLENRSARARADSMQAALADERPNNAAAVDPRASFREPTSDADRKQMIKLLTDQVQHLQDIAGKLPSVTN